MSEITPQLASGAVLAAGGLALAPVAVELGYRLRPGRKVFFASWGFSHALLALVAAVATWLVVDKLYQGVSWFGAYVPVLSALSAGSLVAWFAAQRTQRSPLEALGFGRRSFEPRTLMLGPLAVLASLPLALGAAWILAALGFAADVGAGLLPGTSPSPAAWLAACLWAPIAGEVLFRGFLQPLFVQNFSERGGLAITAVLFAALHGGAALLPMLALGLALGFAKLRSQSTWTAILGHALWNAIVLAAADVWQVRPFLPLAY